MSKFKVGDKVIGIGKQSDRVIEGHEGTVVAVTVVDCLVDFGPGFVGHSRHMSLTGAPSCWHIEHHCLRRRTSRTMAPQTKAIFKHLLDRHSITNVEAQAIYKCRALPRRIADLKEMGVVVKREWRVDLTGQRYVRYVFSHCPAELARAA